MPWSHGSRHSTEWSGIGVRIGISIGISIRIGIGIGFWGWREEPLGEQVFAQAQGERQHEAGRAGEERMAVGAPGGGVGRVRGGCRVGLVERGWGGGGMRDRLALEIRCFADRAKDDGKQEAGRRGRRDDDPGAMRDESADVGSHLGLDHRFGKCAGTPALVSDGGHLLAQRGGLVGSRFTHGLFPMCDSRPRRPVSSSPNA